MNEWMNAWINKYFFTFKKILLLYFTFYLFLFYYFSIIIKLNIVQLHILILYQYINAFVHCNNTINLKYYE